MNSWTSARMASESAPNQRWSLPCSSRYLAPGMWAARYLPCSTGTILSSTRWMIRVGTRIDGNAGRTSISALSRYQAIADPGLAEYRCSRAYQVRKAASSARSGAIVRMATGALPQRSANTLRIHSCCSIEVPGRIVGGRQPAGKGANEQERGHSLGERGGEQDAGWPAFCPADQDRLVHAVVIHHGPDVVHGVVEGGGGSQAVGQAGAAPVEQDQSGEGGEPVHEPAERRPFPSDFEVEEVAGGDDQVWWAGAFGRVGDEQPAAAGVAHCRRRGHAGSVDCLAGTRQPSRRNRVAGLQVSGWPR